jgi:hypothetical protein
MTGEAFRFAPSTYAGWISLLVAPGAGAVIVNPYFPGVLNTPAIFPNLALGNSQPEHSKRQWQHGIDDDPMRHPSPKTLQRLPLISSGNIRSQTSCDLRIHGPLRRGAAH